MSVELHTFELGIGNGFNF